MVRYDVFLDTSGLSCPIPVMKCGKELRKMGSGQVLYLKATDPTSVEDIKTMLNGSKDTMVDGSETGGVFHFYIKKG